jgi:glycosyltransferase involved in cell wall biosynthesis
MEVVRVAYTLEQCWHRVPGGTATAALEVARAMPHVRRDVQLLGVSGRHTDDPAVDFDVSMDVAGLPVAGPLLYETSLRLRWPRVESVWPEAQVVHCTTIIPFATRRKLVATIHDVAFLHHPEFFTRRGNAVFRRSLSALRKRADMVLCSSQATLDDCLEVGFSADRLRLVPLGVRHVAVDDAAVERVRRDMSLPSEFLLFVGTLEPRKNLARLVRAHAARADLPPLVIVGADGWGDLQVVPSERVRFVGHVDDISLHALYKAAAVLVYPSIREGFGLPVLEAMVQSTPVVTSATTSTAEVAGGAAVLVDPLDEDSIADGIACALADADRYVALGRERVHVMTWERAAALTASAYDEVLEA